MIIANELHGVEVRGGEMADVEIDLEVLRHCYRLRKTLGSCELVRIFHIGVAVHGNIDLVFFRKRCEALCNAQLSRSGDDVHPKSLRRLKSPLELLVRVIVSEVNRIREKRNAGIVESLADGFVMVHWR